MSHHDVIVIGAGQAGLAIGYHLAQQGRRFTILEAADGPAAAWRSRWESLRLFTPARHDSLPGLAFPGDPDHYPTRDEVVAYLTDYARHFALPVEYGSRVKALRRDGDGYVVELEDRTDRAEQVVVATGPFQVPRVPEIAERLGDDVVQLHSADYRTPDTIPAGPVLVVGGGNTGFQIAEELAGSHEVHLSVGSRQMPLPQRVLGRDIFSFLDRHRADGQDGRLAHRPADEGPRQPDRLHAARRTPARHPDPRPRRPRPTERRSASRTARASRSRRSSGRPASASTTPGSTRRSSTAAARWSISAASPSRPGCTSSASLAAHARLGAARLGQGRRRLHRGRTLVSRSCTRRTTAAPSPTAVAQRLSEPERASPAA